MRVLIIFEEHQETESRILIKLHVKHLTYPNKYESDLLGKASFISCCNRSRNETSLQANVPLGSVTIKKADLSELPKCECKLDAEHPCGRDSECLNAMMMYECHPALCPAGEKCENQFFTKRQYPAQQHHRTDKRGWGLRAMEDIKKVAIRWSVFISLSYNVLRFAAMLMTLYGVCRSYMNNCLNL